jgi:2-iminobutanoate/2-iminopropanoate deaminase
MRKSKVVIAFLVVFYAGVAFGDDKKIILSLGAKPGGNYSQGILINGTLYISGQGGEDTTGKIPGDFDTEVRQCLDNIGTVLKAAGMSPADVVSVQVYLTDVDKFERMNAVYTSYFKEPRPTRTPVVVARLVGPGNIEITLRPGSSCTRRGGKKGGAAGSPYWPNCVALF